MSWFRVIMRLVKKPVLLEDGSNIHSSFHTVAHGFYAQSSQLLQLSCFLFLMVEKYSLKYDHFRNWGIFIHFLFYCTWNGRWDHKKSNVIFLDGEIVCNSVFSEYFGSFFSSFSFLFITLSNHSFLTLYFYANVHLIFISQVIFENVWQCDIIFTFIYLKFTFIQKDLQGRIQPKCTF